MEVTTQDLIQIIGQKEAKIFALERLVRELSEALRKSNTSAIPEATKEYGEPV